MGLPCACAMCTALQAEANSSEQASGIQDGRERKAQVLGALGVRPGLGSGSRAHF